MQPPRGRGLLQIAQDAAGVQQTMDLAIKYALALVH